jgi:hypothetical protein
MAVKRRRIKSLKESRDRILLEKAEKQMREQEKEIQELLRKREEEAKRKRRLHKGTGYSPR